MVLANDLRVIVFGDYPRVGYAQCTKPFGSAEYSDLLGSCVRLEKGTIRFVGEHFRLIQETLNAFVVVTINLLDQRLIVPTICLKITPVQPAQIFFPILTVAAEGQSDNLIQVHIEEWL